MKSWLVTGSDGFIGSHVVENLLNRGDRVVAFVLYNSFNSWGWLEQIESSNRELLQIHTGDVRDYGSVIAAMQGCTHVLHLAALIAIPYSYQAPDSYVETNINGTLNILRAARELNVSRVLTTSTSEVYGTAQSVPITESHRLQGQSPYSASKIGADRMAEAFHRSFDLPVVIARPFNTFGPRQSARAVIPTILTQLLSGRDTIKLGSTNPTRDFVYVKDTAEGLIRLAQCDAAIGQEVNIASGNEISIGQLAQELINLIRSTARVVQDDVRLRPENSEVERLVGCTEKLQALTGWKPTTNFTDGLKDTIAWFKDPVNLSRYKTSIYNV
jgi:NAD dependent epimerase/dehydratase